MQERALVYTCAAISGHRTQRDKLRPRIWDSKSVDDTTRFIDLIHDVKISVLIVERVKIQAHTMSI